MIRKMLLFILVVAYAVTLASCKTAVKEEQPVMQPTEPDVLTQPATRTGPDDNAPSPQENVIPETIEEPKEAPPADADTYYTLGQSLYNTGHYQDAVIAFKETLAIERHNDRARYDLARAHLMLEEHAAAQEEYKLLLKTDPDMADALREEAVKLVSLNDRYKLIVQVGAFRHSNNAKYLLDDLKDRYLFVYMEKADRLYKVLIHGIKTMAEGNRIMNEIKKRHDIHPFLIIRE